jgi:hypothetical protein
MLIDLRVKTRRVLCFAGVFLCLGLLIQHMPAQQDSRAEKLRLQTEEDRLNKKIAELEGNLRDLKQYERYVISLTDPKVILTEVAPGLGNLGIPVKFPARKHWPKALTGIPYPLSDAQFDNLVLVIDMDSLLIGPGDKNHLKEIKQEHLDKIKARVLEASRLIQKQLEDVNLNEINQETTLVLQDINRCKADRDRVRADFARLTGESPAAGGGRTYDDKGKSVYVSCGEQAFADVFVYSNPGHPAPKGPSGTDRDGALKRDYNEAKDTGYYTLGCRGAITLRFSQVYLVDGPGADLHVFEIGPDVEGTKLEIRTDDGPWIPVGNIGGGAVQVDIHDALASRDMLNLHFSYVRLTDLGQKCAGNWPGADIDAVAALHCLLR